jgi:glutamate/tyrosine decarboxylase-like PLP-dependent enzyme
MAKSRQNPIDIQKAEFQQLGYQLIDTIANLFDTVGENPITPGESPSQLQKVLGSQPFPKHGEEASSLLPQTSRLLLEHSLFNGHPKFFGYITASPSPLGALADLLAAAINANVGAHILSPMATEIEKQAIQWLAEMIGVSPSYGGIMVSGGNMANFTGFLAARTAKAPKSIKEKGISDASHKMLVYCSQTTHTWVEKAAILFGHGSDAIRWIPADARNQMDNNALEQRIQEDIAAGHQPFMVVGTAGDVSTGTVDKLDGIAAICKKYDLWFHVDGAYGVPAAVLPELKPLFAGLEEADSIAMDPHKWLYNPLEAGCTLVKNPQHLTDAFSSNPAYYKFDKFDGEQAQNFYAYGLQNSRGFRALKVWMGLKQLGREGYVKLIREDIDLAKLMYSLADQHPELEAVIHSLSITCLRYVPSDLPEGVDQEAYLNQLNEALVDQLQLGGKVFFSNAIVQGKYCLRACIVNFRTTKEDIEEVVEMVVEMGRGIDERMRELED